MMNLKRYYQHFFHESNRAERIWMMAKIEFKLRYYENKLGILWALFKPASQIAVYYIVFQTIMKSGIDNYAVYLFSGLVLWIFFAETTLGTIGILRTKKYLYEYTNMKKIEIYMASLLSNTIGLVFNLGIFVFVAFLTGVYPNIYYFIIPLLLITLIILSLGVALILSNLYVLFKDITQIWSIFISFGFFLSPILYSGERFSESLPWVNYVNPIAGIILNSRDILLYNKLPNWNLMAFDFVYALAILGLGLFTLNKISYKASEIL